MTRDISFTPSATVEVAEDGSLTLEIDWSASAQGEYDNATDTYATTVLTERVSEHLDGWLRSLPSWDDYRQRVEIGKLLPAHEWARERLNKVRDGDLHLHEKELVELNRLATPSARDMLAIALDILNNVDGNDQVDIAQNYIADALGILKGATNG